MRTGKRIPTPLMKASRIKNLRNFRSMKLNIEQYVSYYPHTIKKDLISIVDSCLTRNVKQISNYIW